MENEKFIKLEDFEIYQIAMEIGEEVWNIVSVWNNLAQNTVGTQIIRSADSIAANIAEGYGRFTYKERKRFCYFSRGSLMETKSWSRKSLNRKLVSQDIYDKLLQKMENHHKMLNSYIKTLREKEKNSKDEY